MADGLVWESDERDVFNDWADEMVEKIETLLWKYAECDRLFPPPSDPAAPLTSLPD